MNEKASRRIATIAFWGSMVLLALLPAFVPALMSSVAFNVFSLVLAVLTIGAWVHFDARVRDVTIGPVTRLSIVLFAVLAVPIYVFRTRGLQGGLLWLLKVLGLFLLSVLFIGAMLMTLGILVK